MESDELNQCAGTSSFSANPSTKWMSFDDAMATFSPDEQREIKDGAATLIKWHDEIRTRHTPDD